MNIIKKYIEKCVDKRIEELVNAKDSNEVDASKSVLENLNELLKTPVMSKEYFPDIDSENTVYMSQIGGDLKELFPSKDCLLYTSPSPRDRTRSRMPSSA